ncbi:MAG TPA: PEP-CTERM sorting domain-containing protein [Pirellulales bacterium]|nr:PEP-CTERM sorting domain-containing protein [Pirellulales bacterium]
MKTLHITTVIAALVLFAAACDRVFADPLSGETLKFQQLPLNKGLAPSVGGQQYPGHDEWSTAYASPAPNLGTYQGDFMADDFADNFSTPVVHVRWWGSYDQNQSFQGVQKFLIAFESDLPNDPLLNGASRPDQPLLTQVVTSGPLSPGSGTFTESLINGNVPEHLYQYNAELALPFNELADTVYWLKIVALVDPATEGAIKWGWHDRDWGIKDTLASPNVTPGETAGTLIDPNGVPQPVWHFQDDAVSGQVIVTDNGVSPPNIVQQSGYRPENYISIPGAVPIDGPPGIENFSKDLAFELFTRVPEPSTVALASIGAVGFGCTVWRKRRRRKTA